MSALTIGVVLFLAYGALYVLIGALTPVMLGREIGPQIMFVSSRTDTILFGGTPADLLRADPQLAQLRSMLILVIAGLLLSAGILILGITWFALREREAWALAVLTLAGLAVLPLWFLVLRPYVTAGAAPGLGDLPPFMWFPTAVLLPAVVASWIGLQQ